MSTAQAELPFHPVNPSRRTVLAGIAGLLAASAVATPVSSSPLPTGGSAALPAQPPKGQAMGTITTKDGTQVCYKDWDQGQPVVFSHGWPLTADAGEDQMFLLTSQGYSTVKRKNVCRIVTIRSPVARS
jgi:non-heme chloroperoxidase